MQLNNPLLMSACLSIALLLSMPVVADDADDATVERGKYIIEIGGCNDCHTSGYALSGGATPESKWLAGDSIGFRGPWGTTYALNLRTYMQELSEYNWLIVAKTLQTRPPMPWWALNAMAEDDLRAVYRYIKRLGPVENEVPDYLTPD